MSTGLRQFPDDVLDRMSLGQATTLAKFWKKHPTLIHSGMVAPADHGQVPPVEEKPKYTTRSEVGELLRQWGPKQAMG